MGNNLFGADISKLIKDNIGPGVLDATLVKLTPGTRTAGQLSGGTNPTSTSYACKGFIDSQNRKDIAGTLVEAGDVIIVLLGDTISSGAVAPDQSDKITIESATHVIKAIDRDPDAATYTCLASARTS
jgi:hypothetical protein